MIRNIADSENVVVVNIFDNGIGAGNLNAETVAAVESVFVLVDGYGVSGDIKAVNGDGGAVVGNADCAFFVIDGVGVGSDSLIGIAAAQKQCAVRQSQRRCGVDRSVGAVVVDDEIFR